MSEPPSYAAPVEFELTGEVFDGSRPQRSERLQVLAGAAPSAGSRDDRGRERRGGDGRTLQPVVLLLPDAAPVTLLDTWMNNARVNQSQHLRTAPDRATLEQRRATPNPDDAVFVASGEGRVAERRRLSKTEPAPGVPTSERIAARGRQDERPDEAGVRPHQAQQASVAAGIHRGRGQRQDTSAAAQLARPTVDRGPAATRATTLDARIRDDSNAELLSAQPERSWVESSVTLASERGAGMGGAHALGTPGLGSPAHEGSSARPYRPGPGRRGALDTSDSRYIRWFNLQRHRVESRVVFPLERALAKDQGTTLYRVVLHRDGKLVGRPSLVRSSGYRDFDRAAREAIDATPFAPLPPEIAPERERVSVLIPIEFFNPMVQ